MDEPWFKNALIYNLHVGTFMDADGDGVGDFDGIIQRLDYLAWLGVDALWLAPFQPSPQRDFGYDISDYYGVDARYGSVGDFLELVREAHGRGMRVLVDLVVNHTSDQHSWFRKAREDASSRYRDWYVWRTRRPRNWNKGMVFPGVQRSLWTRDAKARAFYRHRFYAHQPDLNTDNPEVRAEIRRIMQFWLHLGVDGFRVDALPFVLESKRGARLGPTRFKRLAEMRAALAEHDGAVLLGEANVPPAENCRYFGAGRHGVDLMFNFHVNQHLFCSLATQDARPLAAALRATQRIPSNTQWAVFLRNHDELDLGRLTPAQRSIVLAQFGAEPQMRIYRRGIRRRLASMLQDRRRLELAYSTLFSLPGAPVIHYGDEIGMGENLTLPERDAVRTPMQWSTARNAGFSTARRLARPVIRAGPRRYQSVNVEQQRTDPDSLLNWMAAMTRLRKSCAEIGDRELRLLRTGARPVLAIRYASHRGDLVIVNNLSGNAQDVRIEVDHAREDLVDLRSGERIRSSSGGEHRIALEGYGYRWYRLRRRRSRAAAGKARCL